MGRKKEKRQSLAAVSPFCLHWAKEPCVKVGWRDCGLEWTSAPEEWWVELREPLGAKRGRAQPERKLGAPAALLESALELAIKYSATLQPGVHVGWGHTMFWSQPRGLRCGYCQNFGA